MNDVPENELFSAYLDGELTADEQAHVERLLAASPAARQLVDDLRALSASLQALPTHRIGEDISARVLRAAERRMLSGPVPAAAGMTDATQAAGPPWRALLRRVARPRNLVWPGVAVAVALLLMVFNPDATQEQNDGTIAMRPPVGGGEFEAAPATTPSLGAASDEAGAMLADMPAAESARDEGERYVVGKRAAELKLETARGVPPARRGSPDLAGKRVARSGDRPQRVDVPAAAAPESAPAMRAPSPPPVVGKAGGMGGGRFGGYGAAAGREVAAERNKRDALPTAKPSPPEGEPPETALVVWCDVTARAVHEQLFQELLRKRQITWDELAEARGARKAGVSANVALSESRAYGVAATKPSEAIQLDVEATPGQLKALLADLEGRPDEFSLLSYTSPPSVAPFADEAPQEPGPLAAQESSAAEVRQAVPSHAGDGGRKRGRFTDLNTFFDAARPGKAADHLRRRTEAGQRPAAMAGQLADSDELEQAAEQEKPRASEKKLESDRRGQKESEAEESPRENQVEQRLAVQVEKDLPKLKMEREGVQKLGRRTLGERLDRYEPKYRVRFVLQVRTADRPDVAASMAKEPTPADAAADAAPPAEAAEAAEVDQ